VNASLFQLSPELLKLLLQSLVVLLHVVKVFLFRLPGPAKIEQKLLLLVKLFQDLLRVFEKLLFPLLDPRLDPSPGLL